MVSYGEEYIERLKTIIYLQNEQIRCLKSSISEKDIDVEYSIQDNRATLFEAVIDDLKVNL